MALKFKIAKSAYDALSDEMKNEYIAGDKDGEFVLDVSDLPQGEDTGPLKRALESEKSKNKTLKTENDTLKNTISEFPNVDELKANHEKEVGKFKTFTEKTLIDGKAMELATKISTVPSLIANIIKDRIVVDLSGDSPVAKLKGADGKTDDALTFDKLGQELVANKEYAGIMIGSKASGGGAPRTPIKPVGSGAPNGSTGEDKPMDLARASGKDLVSHIAARKAAETGAEA